MSTATPRPAFTRTASNPPLQNGDRLTRAEFERRFDATLGLKKAELLEGIVYMTPPVSFVHHGEPHGNLGGLFFQYRAATPGVRSGDNSSLRLDLDNEPQPDAFLMISPERGGQVRIDDDGYIVGAPELIGEIAASSVSYDLHVKLNVYRRSGVREYIVWRTLDRAIDYFILQDGEYLRLPVGTDGISRSETFPGLWLDTGALLAGNLAAVTRVLQEGLSSPDHAAFVELLRGRAIG